MSNKPENELELSPHVISYWEELGYCVHGEVAIFGKSTFIDHVAHTGPCHQPDYVVGIEMKRGAGKSLRDQLFKLDTRHVADELWGVVIANPRDATLKAWDGLGRWNQPGLLVWTSEGLETLQKPTENRDYTRKMKRDRLLLIEGNRQILAGYPSGHEDNNYLTHWSVTKDSVERQILSSADPVSTEILWDNLPRCIEPYKRPKSAFNKVLRVLEDEEKKVRVVKREGRIRFYAAHNEEDPGWEVDTQFEEFFDSDLLD